MMPRRGFGFVFQTRPALTCVAGNGRSEARERPDDARSDRGWPAPAKVGDLVICIAQRADQVMS